MSRLPRIQDIVLASDAGYYEGLLTTITSAACHLESEGCVTFHILDGGLTSNQREDLESSLSILLPTSMLNFVPFKPSHFDELPAIRGESHMTYARLASPELIEADHFLYIDCDILVFKDLTQFPARAEKKDICAGIQDPTYLFMKRDHAGNHLTSKEKEMPYFNAGVLFINRTAWLSNDITRKCVAFLKNHPTARAWDQTAINHTTLHHKVVTHDHSWNRNVTRYSNQTLLMEDLQQVYHYIGSNKPWAQRIAPPENAVGHLIYHLFCHHLFTGAPVPVEATDITAFARKAFWKRLFYTLTFQSYQSLHWKNATVTLKELETFAQRTRDYLTANVPGKILAWP